MEDRGGPGSSIHDCRNPRAAGLNKYVRNESIADIVEAEAIWPEEYIDSTQRPAWTRTIYRGEVKRRCSVLAYPGFTLLFGITR